MAAEQLIAIGRLPASEVWAGFSRTSAGFNLVFGEPDGRVRSAGSEDPARHLDLLLLALVYFTESADEPPPELEATHADLAALLRWLTEAETDQQLRHRLRQALDAVDDGLAGEAVAAPLSEAARTLGAEQIERDDPLDLLMNRYRQLPR